MNHERVGTHDDVIDELFRIVFASIQFNISLSLTAECKRVHPYNSCDNNSHTICGDAMQQHQEFVVRSEENGSR